MPPLIFFFYYQSRSDCESRDLSGVTLSVRRCLGQGQALFEQDSPCPSGTAAPPSPIPRRPVVAAEATRAQRAAGGCGRRCGTGGSSRVEPGRGLPGSPLAGRTGPGRTGPGAPGGAGRAGQWRSREEPSRHCGQRCGWGARLVRRRRGRSQVCVRGPGGPSVPCLCGAQELSRPC